MRHEVATTAGPAKTSELANADASPIRINGARRWPNTEDRQSWLAVAGHGRRFLAPAAVFVTDQASYLAAYALLGAVGALNSLVLEQSLLLVSQFTIALFWLARLYPGYRLHLHELFRRRLVATLQVGIGASIAALVLTGDWHVVTVIIGFAISAQLMQFLLQPATRWLLWRLGCWGEPAAIIADPELTIVLWNYFRKEWWYGVKPIPSVGEGRVVGNPRVALLAGKALPNGADLAALRRCYREVVLLADLPHMKVSGLQSSDVHGDLGLKLRDGESDARLNPLRRILDVLIAIVALVSLAPLIVIAAAGIWFVDPGPVFFRQAREGRGGRTIHVLKLRTMYQNAGQRLDELLRSDPAARAQWETHFKLKNDPRILPMVGRFLRSTSCDELPQFFNVIAGDMTVVGPRPFPDYHLSAMPPEFRQKRSSVTPGLTGLWQISERSEADLVQQQQLDEFYIDNRSVWFDWYIMLRTVHAVVKHDGAY